MFRAHGRASTGRAPHRRPPPASPRRDPARGLRELRPRLRVRRTPPFPILVACELEPKRHVTQFPEACRFRAEDPQGYQIRRMSYVIPTHVSIEGSTSPASCAVAALSKRFRSQRELKNIAPGRCTGGHLPAAVAAAARRTHTMLAITSKQAHSGRRQVKKGVTVRRGGDGMGASMPDRPRGSESPWSRGPAAQSARAARDASPDAGPCPSGPKLNGRSPSLPPSPARLSPPHPEPSPLPCPSRCPSGLHGSLPLGSPRPARSHGGPPPACRHPEPAAPPTSWYQRHSQAWIPSAGVQPEMPSGRGSGLRGLRLIWRMLKRLRPCDMCP